MPLTFVKLCSYCNKEFELKRVEHNGCLRASVTNFEDCPHCNKRNDTWISVKWAELKTNQSNPELEELLYCCDGLSTEYSANNSGNANKWLRHISDAYQAYQDSIELSKGDL